MPKELRKHSDLVDAHNKMERVLLAIRKFGIGFEAEGTLIQYSPGDKREHYFVPADANISDDIIETCNNKSEDEILDILLQNNVLKRLPKS